MLILAYVTWAITKTRTEVLDRAHAALIAKHEELGAAYTKLHAMRTKLFEQEKLAAIGVLAAGVAHEINNPMTFVTANLQSMAEDLRELAGDPELLREYAEEVLPATLDGVQRVNTIVADILRFARTTPEEPELYDLCSQIETALRISQSRTKHCVIRMGTCASPPLLGHPQQIVQALVNVLLNAAQASPPGSTIEIDVCLEGTEVAVRVTDHGSGMSPEVRAHLFEPFFTTKPGGEGTGLGLAIVRGVVASQGGSIAVDSELGCGSCFTLRLPVDQVLSRAA
jgi:signal transduction histidine kinase